MDEIQIKTDKLFANTKKQPLVHHLFAVGYLAYATINRLIDNEKLSAAAFIAGCLHDLGKIDPGFQTWVSTELKKKKAHEVPEEGQHIDKKTGTFSFEKHPRHNEISLLLYHLLNDEKYVSVNNPTKDIIRHTLYWHHAKPIRKEEFKSLDTVHKKLKNNIGNDGFTTLIHTVKQIVMAINGHAEEYFADDPEIISGILDYFDDDRIYELGKTPLPEYKRYNPNDVIKEYRCDIILNAKSNLCRAAVVSSDRLVSSIDGEALNNFIEERRLDTILDESMIQYSKLDQQVQKCINGFVQRDLDRERNKAQETAANRLTDVNHVGVLNGPAGCGKTKIALEWALNTRAKKIIWICPRVQVCQGLIRDLTGKEYLPDTRIELNTGEFKTIYHAGNETETPEGEEFSGDIVITTIDQVINTITTHTKITGLMQYMNAHVVFDEYHEYITMPAFNLLFTELVECKKLQENRARALLVSATPNYYFIENVLEIDHEDIVGIPSFNRSPYQISFENFNETKWDETNPFYRKQPENTIVISNTAITAQRSFIKNQSAENAILFHSKYTKSDKQDCFEKVFKSFKHKGSQKYDILRSGPAVQASLNITSSQMVTEFTHAENWLQRLGRLDRFGENTETNPYIVAIPESLALGGKQTSRCARFLNQLDCLQSAKAWNDYLQNELDGQPVTINQLYQLYGQFYQDAGCVKAIEEDLISAFKKSVDRLKTKLHDPVTFPKRMTPKDTKIRIKKHSLRGDNRFVQMARCEIQSLEGDPEFINQYAYKKSDLDSNLTVSVEIICGHGDSRQNLLAHMAKKHHNIANIKKPYKDSILLNAARNPETPIYLSYTPEDLQEVGGESQRHQHAIYYAVGEKQSIGAVSINQLRPVKEN